MHFFEVRRAIRASRDNSLCALVMKCTIPSVDACCRSPRVRCDAAVASSALKELPQLGRMSSEMAASWLAEARAL